MRLKRPDGRMCCLGVLCELHRRETGLGKWVEQAGDDGQVFDCGDHYATADVPKMVREWSGLRKSLGDFGGRFGDSLSCLNDTGSNFTEIAQVIRAQAGAL
jgi:hypothetical protein